MVDEILVLQIQGLNVHSTQSICDIYTNTGVSLGAIQGLVKKWLFEKHCHNLKLLLTNKNKLLWVAWIRNLIKDDGIKDDGIKDDGTYCNMMQYVHIAEEWFTLVTNSNGFYSSIVEEDQYGNVQQKVLKLCYCQPLLVHVLSCQQMSYGRVSLASGFLLDSIWLLATAKTFQKEQWNDTRCQQINKRYMRCCLRMSYLQLTGSGLLIGGGRQSCVNRTMPLPTFLWTTLIL